MPIFTLEYGEIHEARIYKRPKNVLVEIYDQNTQRVVGNFSSSTVGVSPDLRHETRISSISFLERLQERGELGVLPGEKRKLGMTALIRIHQSFEVREYADAIQIKPV
jgi:hypothetical protein